MIFTPMNDDPLASFELPDDVMSTTLEHAISDAASATHERGHAVAAALQRALKGSHVEYAFPGIVTAHLASGAVANCGGPAIGWMIDVQRAPGVDTHTLDLPALDDDEPATVAKAMAKALRRY